MKTPIDTFAPDVSSTALPASGVDVGRSLAETVRIPINGISVAGDLIVPANALGLVLFAPGSIGRESPRNIFVARQLEAARFGTLLFDLLTPVEGIKNAKSGYWYFDIELLAHRVSEVTQWLFHQELMHGRKLGYFGSGTGAAAALIAAERLGPKIGAVVCRGGRVDLAGSALGNVVAPTLFIVGEDDTRILDHNRRAFEHLTCAKQMRVIPGATHFFEEPGTLNEVASFATSWFRTHLKTA